MKCVENLVKMLCPIFSKFFPNFLKIFKYLFNFFSSVSPVFLIFTFLRNFSNFLKIIAKFFLRPDFTNMLQLAYQELTLNRQLQ